MKHINLKIDFSILQGSYILVDTNVLIKFSRQSELYKPLIDTLLNLDTQLVIIEEVKFELLKGTVKESIWKEKLELIHDLGVMIIPTGKDTDQEYKTLIRCYKTRSGAIDTVDLLLTSTLLKYGKHSKIFLLTENIKDFPEIILDQAVIASVSDQDIIRPLVFYRINPEKLKECQNGFLDT